MYEVIQVTTANLFNEAMWARSLWRTDGRTDTSASWSTLWAAPCPVVTTRRYVLRWFFLRVSLGVGPTHCGFTLCALTRRSFRRTGRISRQSCGTEEWALCVRGADRHRSSVNEELLPVVSMKTIDSRVALSLIIPENSLV